MKSMFISIDCFFFFSFLLFLSIMNVTKMVKSTSYVQKKYGPEKRKKLRKIFFYMELNVFFQSTRWNFPSHEINWLNTKSRAELITSWLHVMVSQFLFLCIKRDEVNEQRRNFLIFPQIFLVVSSFRDFRYPKKKQQKIQLKLGRFSDLLQAVELFNAIFGFQFMRWIVIARWAKFACKMKKLSIFFI